jgi:hypothetical protein
LRESRIHVGSIFVKLYCEIRCHIPFAIGQRFQKLDIFRVETDADDVTDFRWRDLRPVNVEE